MWQTSYSINAGKSWRRLSIRPYFVCCGTKKKEILVHNPTDCYTTQAEAPANFTQCGYFHCQYHNTFQLNGTGHFIMFSVITNIYNKKTKKPTSMEFFTATGKLRKFFLTTWDVRCVHHGWHGTHRYDFQVLATHADACVARTWKSYRCVPCHLWCTHRTSLVVKKNFLSFPVAVKNSIKVGPLVFLL